MIIEPISERQQAQVREATLACLHRAGELFRIELQPLPVSFDLSGRAAGMYRSGRGGRAIRYNPYLFAKYFDANLGITVPHEVAHYVTDRLYGLRNIRPHGVEWQTVMQALGAEPRATARYDLEGIPVRRQRRFSYRCDCNTYQLSSARHNRIRRGQASYHCRACGTALVAAE
ncbi:MAG: SprT-like domain-containing protein [Thiogranum sp.]